MMGTNAPATRQGQTHRVFAPNHWILYIRHHNSHQTMYPWWGDIHYMHTCLESDHVPMSGALTSTHIRSMRPCTHNGETHCSTPVFESPRKFPCVWYRSTTVWIRPCTHDGENCTSLSYRPWIRPCPHHQSLSWTPYVMYVPIFLKLYPTNGSSNPIMGPCIFV